MCVAYEDINNNSSSADYPSSLSNINANTISHGGSPTRHGQHTCEAGLQATGTLCLACTSSLSSSNELPLRSPSRQCTAGLGSW